VLAELAARDCFSPSELERYLGCPFGWFLERVVRVEDVEVELDGRALGTLAHAALCSTYRDLKSAGSLPVTADNLALAVRAARRAIQTLVDDGAFPGSVADRRMAAWRLTRMVESLLEMESASGSALVAEETELWVGGTHGVDIGGVCLRGKIDRVDADAKHRVSFVIDYKTGSIPAKADIGTEKGLQLPLYLLALSRERPESRVVGGAYVSLADQRRSGVAVSGETDLLGAWAEGCRVLDEDAEDVLFSDAVRVASGAADGIRRGRIAPLPDRKCPFWCQLGPACRAQTGGYRP
jgi:ATP-dependent helicase/DNAse subunit B